MAIWPTCCREADWLILCCPASPMTRGIANAAAFAAMPAGAHFVNVARGEVAVETRRDRGPAASGQLAGAYLDVFEREPLDPASPLWDLPNVIVSPHTASHSLGQNEAIFEIFLDNLARLRAGQKLRNDVDNLGFLSLRVGIQRFAARLLNSASLRSSAGKKHSMRTSCRVTSCGVPSVAMVVKTDSDLPPTM